MSSFDKDYPSLDELLQDLHDLKDLVEHRGWAKLMQVADAQRESRSGFVYAPLEGPEGVYKQEFAKGEMAGIKLFQTLPHNVIEGLTDDVERMNKEMNNEPESSDG